MKLKYNIVKVGTPDSPLVSVYLVGVSAQVIIEPTDLLLSRTNNGLPHLKIRQILGIKNKVRFRDGMPVGLTLNGLSYRALIPELREACEQWLVPAANKREELLRKYGNGTE